MIRKKPVEEIQTENAKATIKTQHEKFGKTVGVNACFGSSNIGIMTGFICIKTVKEIPNAFMRCPIALWPGVEGPTQVLLHDDFQVVIDGCKARCLKKALDKAGIKVELAYALDEDFGIEKKPGPEFDEGQKDKIADKIIKEIDEMIKP